MPRNASRILDVLIYMADKPRGVTSRQVAEDIGIARQNASKFLRRLNQTGIAVRMGTAPTGNVTGPRAPTYALSPVMRGKA